MGGKRGQVAVYVLAGVILVLVIGLSIYLVRQKRAEVEIVAPPSVACDLQGNPELAAEVSRIQSRLDDCLGEVAGDSLTEYQQGGLPITDIAEVEEDLANDISMRFGDCYYRFNTREKVLITDTEAPRVIATLSDASLFVQATYASALVEQQSCAFHEHTVRVETSFKDALGNARRAREALSSPAPDGGAPSGMEIVAPDCSVNLDAYRDQGWYADVIRMDDRMIALLYDYNGWDGASDVEPIVIELPPCTPA